jgi:hypothetical protein
VTVVKRFSLKLVLKLACPPSTDDLMFPGDDGSPSNDGGLYAAFPLSSRVLA